MKDDLPRPIRRSRPDFTERPKNTTSRLSQRASEAASEQPEDANSTVVEVGVRGPWNPRPTPSKNTDDRRGSEVPMEERDYISQIPGWLALIAGGLFGASAMLTDSARPGFRHTGFAEMFGNHARIYWKRDTLDTAFYLIIGCFVVCMLGLLFKSQRVRRQADRIDVAAAFLTGMGILSAVGIGWYVFRFA